MLVGAEAPLRHYTREGSFRNGWERDQGLLRRWRPRRPPAPALCPLQSLRREGHRAQHAQLSPRVSRGTAVRGLLGARRGACSLCLRRAQRWLTCTTVAWCFLAKIITNDACVFAVAAVVSSQFLLDTVGQGPLSPCAPHVIHVDGPLPLPEIGHGAGSGRSPASTGHGRSAQSVTQLNEPQDTFFKVLDLFEYIYSIYAVEQGKSLESKYCIWNTYN